MILAALFDSLSQNFSGAVLSWERDAIEGLVDGLIEKIGARCYETGKRHEREMPFSGAGRCMESLQALQGEKL